MLGPESFVLRDFECGRGRRRSPADREPRGRPAPRPGPGALLAPPRAHAGTCCGRARTRVTAGEGPPPPSRPPRTGGSRATRPSSCPPRTLEPTHGDPADPNLTVSGSRPARSQDGRGRPDREWIVTNGLGGYASGTVCGVPTRRYHGLLIAALPAPLGRTMMLNQLNERLGLPDGTTRPLGGRGARRPARAEPAAGRPRRVPPRGRPAGLAVRGRRGRAGEAPAAAAPPEHGLRHLPAASAAAGPAVRLELRPLGPLPLARRAGRRPHPARTGSPPGATATRSRAGDIPPLRLTAARGRDPAFTLDAAQTTELPYRLEAQRGYESTGDMWSPGYFRVELTPGRAGRRWSPRPSRGRRSQRLEPPTGRAARPSGTPPIRGCIRRPRPARRRPVAAELVLAADQFLITPGRPRRGHRPRPRRRRGGPHRDRRLPLVHRLGPRHDDQPRRADPHHRPRTTRPATSSARSPTTSATA